MDSSPLRTSGNKRGHHDGQSSVSESVMNIVQDLNILPAYSHRPIPALIIQIPSSHDSQSLEAEQPTVILPTLVRATFEINSTEDEESICSRVSVCGPIAIDDGPTTLTPDEQALILNLADPPRQFEWQMRCLTGHNSTYSSPVRISDREGRTKLIKGRTRAAPYQNGVFRFRMGTAQHQSPITRRGVSLTPICYSPKSPRSD